MKAVFQLSLNKALMIQAFRKIPPPPPLQLSKIQKPTKIFTLSTNTPKSFDSFTVDILYFTRKFLFQVRKDLKKLSTTPIIFAFDM